MPVLQLLSALICLIASFALGFSAGCIMFCPASDSGCAYSLLCFVLFVRFDFTSLRGLAMSISLVALVAVLPGLGLTIGRCFARF